MGKNKKRFATICLSSALVLSPFSGLLSNSYSSTVAHAQTKAPIKAPTEQLPANLTPEQLAAFTKLQSMNGIVGLQLSKDVNLKSSDEIPVIVEFKQRPAKLAVIDAASKGKKLSVTEAKKQVDASHDTFKNDLATIFASKGAKKGASPSYKVNRSYKHAFNGVAMKLPANQVQSLLNSMEVKAVYSDLQVKVEQPVKAKASDVGTMGLGMSDELSFLQVDKLHDEGYTGKGVKVGVIDTGIDYNHPDLKGAYKGGYDFVDNDADPMETTYEDWVKAGKPSDAKSYMTTHGTHVSGTIAGQGKNNSKYATTGIAPDADLYAYRVLGPYGGGYYSSILAGIDKAIEDGMDVINMSLGGNTNDPWDPISLAADNAVLLGVTAVIAAGNAGNQMYTLGSPGTASLALTVGASNVPRTIPTFKGSLAAGQKAVGVNLQLFAFGFGDDITKFKGQTLPVVDVGMGRTEDFFNKDVKGKIALISRGDFGMDFKINFAKQNGAAAVLLYNNNPTEGQIPYYFAEGKDFISTFSLTQADGLALKQQVEAGYTNFNFGEMSEIKTQGDQLADFSSRGPSHNTYEIKPEVTAPGVDVLSTAASDVVNDGQGDNYQYAYERMSGTSMATPNVAGIAALLLQAKPGLQPEDVKSILMNTADPLSNPYSVFEVGAGRVDPYKAIHSDMEIKVMDTTPILKSGGKETFIDDNSGGISFGQLYDPGQDIVDSKTVVMKNNGTTAKTYDVKVQFQTGLRGSKDAAKNGVKVETATSVQLKGGEQKKILDSLYIPKTAEKGFYEGYVVYSNKDNPSETYKVPFGFSYENAPAFNTFKIKTHSGTSSILANGNPYESWPQIIVNVTSHVKWVTLMIVDPETNEYIGELTSTRGDKLEPNKDSLSGWMGYYIPFLRNQKKPSSSDINDLFSSLASRMDHLKPGKYKIKAFGITEQGQAFTAKNEEYFFIDNAAPEFKYNLPKGVYEYEAGQKSVSFSGSIYANVINEMKTAGLNVSQADNRVGYTYNQPKDFSPYLDKVISLNSDGTFAGTIPMNESVPILPVRFMAQSISGAGHYPDMPTTYFVKKGTQYVAAKPNNQEIKMGDSVTYTLTMNNANKLKDQTFTFDYLGDYFDIESVTVNPELQKKATVELNDEELQGSGVNKKHRIHIAVKDAGQSIDGTLPVVDVTMKVKDDLYYDGEIDLKNLTSSYINTNGDTVSVPSVSVESYVIPTFSEVLVGIGEEALPLDVDFAKAGATAFVTDENNQKYQGTVMNVDGGYLVSHFRLPVTKKELTYHIQVPGDFEFSAPFTIYKQNGDTIQGESDNLPNFEIMHSGDANGDQVIDIMDAVFLKQHWGTNTRSADFNFDGIVDMKDFAFIENNFLLVNRNATNPLTPKDRYKGQTLESIKKELGLN
ncbi:S8 family serine peptidase [Bacillus sp. sid0103]|uniref:S8 family serine peptidase n=1 Tax=Bacillus sp. sid0103 TaxID=2856337 RepID=UPI001C48E034|nr:S8 family serine peptidase [Bacillus sp. sid0103]MBV7508597.1 S8 family serine peptidase [Bacillus sp. sid0103]